MSRNSQADFTQYVHEFTDKQGVVRFAVAEWDEANNQYTCPMDNQERELTGAHTKFARKLEGLGGYRDRTKALRRARYLFGESND
jgi:hypothetical protein